MDGIFILVTLQYFVSCLSILILFRWRYFKKLWFDVPNTILVHTLGSSFVAGVLSLVGKVVDVDTDFTAPPMSEQTLDSSSGNVVSPVVCDMEDVGQMLPTEVENLAPMIYIGHLIIVRLTRKVMSCISVTEVIYQRWPSQLWGIMHKIHNNKNNESNTQYFVFSCFM